MGESVGIEAVVVGEAVGEDDDRNKDIGVLRTL